RLLLAVPVDSPLNDIFSNSALSAEDIRSNSMKYLTAAPIDLKLIGDEKLVVCEEGEFSAEMMDEMCAKVGFAPNYALRVHSVETAFSFVKAGFGASFIPDSLIRFGNYSEHPNYYPLPDAVAKTDIALVYRKSGYLSKAAQEYGLLLKKLVSIGTWRTS
ncbi:MAG: LysR family transcriptional regulator substrate-binding protein, partial [Ruminiclostridium sp.]